MSARILGKAWVLVAGLWVGQAAAFQMGDQVLLPVPQNANGNLDASSAAVADANGDGRLDVAVFADGFGSSDASLDHVAFIYEQQADGSFAMAHRFTLAPGGTSQYYARGATMVDLDGDGKAEIITQGSGPRDGRLVILSRAPDDTYAEVATLPCPLNAEQILVRDLDRDGNVDLLLQDQRGFAWYRGQGGLAFAPPIYLLGYTANYGGMQIGDVNGDGLDDIIQTPMPGGFGVLYGLPLDRGTGRADFTEPVFVDAVSTDANSAALGDFFGRRRLAVVHETTEYPTANTVRWHQFISLVDSADRGQFSMAFEQEYESGTQRLSGYNQHVVIRATDLDGDGKDDIVIFVAGHLEILLQQDLPQGFAAPILPPESFNSGNHNPASESTHVVDFNGDGCNDLGYVTSWNYVIHYRADCPAPAGLRAMLPVKPHEQRPKPQPRGRMEQPRGGRIR